MATAASILDDAQVYLHDDGTIWSRAELLDYLNDGYKRLLTETSAIRTIRCLDVPPRYTYVISHPWERQQILGQSHQWTWPTLTEAQYACAYRWEIEQLAGATPSNGEAACTQAWERLYSLTVDRADRYAYPSDHLKTFRMAFDSQRLSATSTQELDEYSRTWETDDGLPGWHHGDLGGIKEFAVYLSVSADGQSIETGEPALGLTRTYTGTRTYAFEGPFEQGYAFTVMGDNPNSGLLPGPGYKITDDTTVAADYQAMYSWEKNHLEGTTLTAEAAYIFAYPWENEFAGLAGRSVVGVGMFRSATGARQYLCESADVPGGSLLGTVRSWASADDNLFLDYSVLPETVAEADSPSLLPGQFSKYLRFYVLSRAFGREGEGYHPTLSEHFSQRFGLGMAFLRQIARFAMKARTYQSQGITASFQRPPRVRLPATYPRVPL